MTDASASQLGLQPNDLDPNIQEVTLTTGDATVTVTSVLSGGELGGLLKFQNRVLSPTQNKIGRLAAGLALEFNALHQTGFDLDGGPGDQFFSLQSPEIPVLQNGSGTVTARYVNAADLQASDYLLEYDGSTYTLTRLSDQTQTTLTGFPAVIDGIEIDVTVSPAPGDRFLIRPTADAAGRIGVAVDDPRRIAASATAGTVGDNAVALELAGLEDAKKLLGGKATFKDAYGQMVAEVGTLTRSAEISRGAQEVVKNQAFQDREALSGVNLDEEAANLVKYQQAYQAAAQVVSVASQTFDALINAVR